jgi:uncharacterized surface protein with fasciclin (FAS1) repeats
MLFNKQNITLNRTVMKTQKQNSKWSNSVIMITKSLFAIILVFLTSSAFAQSTVVDIVVNSEDHNTLEAAVIAAELADDLSGAGPFAVFAPTDAAFAALPEGTVASLLEDPTGDLAQILLYHVVGSKVMSSDLVDGEMVTTLNGGKITVKYKDGSFYVDNAKISVADITADNGVVHVIDAVILPSPAASSAGEGCSDSKLAEK